MSNGKHYPQLDKLENGIHNQGPCLVKCPSCGTERKYWSMPGKVLQVPPDRKPVKTSAVNCLKCGTTIFMSGLFGMPWVTPQSVRDPNGYNIAKYGPAAREFLPDDRGW